jgi:hypothetical protein
VKGGVLAWIGAVVVAGNVLAWFTVVRSGPLEGLWASMATVQVPTRADVAPVFPEDLRAQEGRRVSLQGVAFVNRQGVEGDRVRWCVLMPPSRYGCCGISCDPRPELSVYVDCSAAPWAAPGADQVMATVEGTLRLERGTGSWCWYTLEDATVRLLEP